MNPLNAPPHLHRIPNVIKSPLTRHGQLPPQLLLRNGPLVIRALPLSGLVSIPHGGMGVLPMFLIHGRDAQCHLIYYSAIYHTDPAQTQTAVGPPYCESPSLQALSLNVRPIAIASPTLFICVVSVSSASGNFSNVLPRDFDDAIVNRRLKARGRVIHPTLCHQLTFCS